MSACAFIIFSLSAFALISSFFDVISPQNFPITLERETIKVICETFSVIIGHDDVQSITAEFRRVYEA